MKQILHTDVSIMSERRNEVHKDASMCLHGNFVEVCEMCKTETVLSSEQKRELLDVWNKVVLGDSIGSIQDVGDLSRDEIQEFMHEKLMEKVGVLLKQFEIDPDEPFIREIVGEKDLNKKAEREVMYIRHIQKAFDELVNKFDHSKPKSTKWNSWPERMADTKEFNCVGAVLLGIALFEKAGIQQFIGNPTQHVVNIVRVSNGDYWFVDLLNGKNCVQKIEPIQREIVGHQVLEIDHPMIDYRFIPITGKEQIGKFILGNLVTLQKDAYEASQKKEINDREIEEAVAYAKKYRLLEIHDLSEYFAYAFPSTDVNRAPEMRAESERIERLYAANDGIAELTKNFSEEKTREIFEEMNRNNKGIRYFFFEDNQSVLDDVSPELAKFLPVYHKGLANLRENHGEEYEELIEKMLEKVSLLVRAYAKQSKS